MVRWLRWHCPPDTGFEIRTLAVWGRARYLSVTEAPHNTDFHTWMGKKHFFVSFNPPRPGTEPRTLAWKAEVLTTTLGPPPFRLKRVHRSGITNKNKNHDIFINLQMGAIYISRWIKISWFISIKNSVIFIHLGMGIAASKYETNLRIFLFKNVVLGLVWNIRRRYFTESGHFHSFWSVNCRS